jgi:hypothetical protein
MLEPEKYEKFAKMVHDRVVQDVKLRLIYDDIIVREKLHLNETENKEVEEKVRLVVKEFERQQRKEKKAETEKGKPRQIIDEERVR